MAGRNAAREALMAPTSEAGPSIPCDTTGCGEVAFVRGDDGLARCRRCYEGHHNSQAFEKCKALGLTSVEDMQAYCRRLTKRGVFSRPSFDSWAENMKQGTVDAMVRMMTPSDEKALDRLRALCVIDEVNKIVPVELRPALRAERAARIDNERRRVEEVLRQQRATLEARAAAEVERHAD